jgi:hypothetical protein
MEPYFIYENYMVQQHPNCLPLINTFIENSIPVRIVELGTANAGLTNILRKYTDVPIMTIDMYDMNPKLPENVESFKTNIFERNFLIKKLNPFIRETGRTIVLCDASDKVKEFNYFSNIIKKNDIIMAHDYFFDYESYRSSKEWHWCGITEYDILECSKDNDLTVYDENLKSINWVCKIKNNDNYYIDNSIIKII